MSPKRPSGHLKKAAKAADQIYRAAVDNEIEGNKKGRTEEKLCGWSFPSYGWFKLNTDGASKGNHGMASCGGVIRDASGVWIDGFAYNIGHCSSLAAELWGIYKGLDIAWNRGIRR